MEKPFQCRSCSGKTAKHILDLGLQPLANSLRKENELGKPEAKYPLRLAVCTSCWLMQILDILPPAALFSDYVYFSSFSSTMLQHAKEAVRQYIEAFHLTTESFVIEIASNDGYLLKNFSEAKIPCLGIEPAENIAKVAQKNGIETINDFFNHNLSSRLAEEGRQADLVVANNVFAHVPETNDFVKALKVVLKPHGTIVLEFPYGAELIEKNEFDTIYHEHVFYFTLTPLVSLFARHALQIWDVQRTPIHGGSLRLFISHAGTRITTERVTDLLQEESGKGVCFSAYYEDFASNVLKLKEDSRNLILKLKAEGKRIAAYGASAKGSTLLNFFDLGREIIDFVVDRSTYKQGHFTPGTHLPIAAPEALLERMPEYTLLLTWNFADEILKQQREYRDRGGKFIIPIPALTIV